MFCGLDFGTSNSAIGIQASQGLTLAPIEDGQRTLPSAIFFDEELKRPCFGRAAMNGYLLGHSGRLMRGLKSVLGSSLMNEATAVCGQRLTFVEIIATFLAHLKTHAEAQAGAHLSAVVHGRPVRFTDSEDADRRAQDELEAIARRVGFTDISFQFEPIAAATTYEATVERETLALIADIGGGTSDFSLVRLDPARAGRAERGGDVLGNEGVRLGGTDLDTCLSLARVMPEFGYGETLQDGRLRTPNHLFLSLATWSRINDIYSPDARRDIRWLLRQADDPERIQRLADLADHRHGHRVAAGVEEAKITLSDESGTRIDLSYVEDDLMVAVTRRDLEEAVGASMDRLSARVRACLSSAGVGPDRVDVVVMTGGSTLLPAVRRAIIKEVPNAQVHDCDQFGAVAMGLTLEAARRYG
ncbi:MAG TPA: Hsp70 family protein [Azospirillaceae bacterium]|nr:Hsp70 family protein [Azospirillaceae bacterium]